MSMPMGSSPTTLLFPGQGAQRAGMGRDFDARFAASRRTYDEASDALGLDLRAICFTGDDRLAATEFAQPAILATEIAMVRGLVEAFDLAADRFGGHSLGEYSALVAAGVIPFADALRIVRARGRLMQEAVPVGRGRMVAVIGDRSLVTAALDGLAVDVANDNSPDQVVLSGLAEEVREVERRLVERGAPVRVVPLEVSAPFHSRWMVPIEPAFADVLQAPSARWDARRAPAVASNVTGGFHAADVPLVRGRLVRQVSGTVRWRENMRALAAGAGRLVEIGPGRPLRGFFKAVGVAVESITDVRSAARVLGSDAGLREAHA
jgi:[acyl-carrier-protein] S-malonyltransferase/trans-AT polyketide synthase/acyltransferase/oxidoreductase domain-containing protein